MLIIGKITQKLYKMPFLAHKVQLANFCAKNVIRVENHVVYKENPTTCQFICNKKYKGLIFATACLAELMFFYFIHRLNILIKQS